MQNCSNENFNGPNRIISIIYYLALGSNMGDRAAYLKYALEFLGKIGQLHAESSVYETEPVDMAPGTQSFYNMVVCFYSQLTPQALLSEIKKFEAKMGRDVTSQEPIGPNKSEYQKNGQRDDRRKKRVYLSRPLDIDILLAGNRIINSANLMVPHERMTERAFVLLPLNEIVPTVNHPVSGKTVGELLADLQATVSTGFVKRLGPVHRLTFSEPGDL
jgi:2-amino-4-hydroxy-6-hydroxymethyldihydropteridine diphosphokinase